MRQTRRLLQVLWDTGNFFIRLAVVLILGWPVALTVLVLVGVRGDTTVALALIPVVALVLLLLVIPPMLPVLVMAVPPQPFGHIWGLGRVRFPSRAERLRTLKRVLKFLTLVAGTELAIGIYLAGVPVWNDPGLIWWLLAATVVFVMFWLSGYRHRWFRRLFVLIVLAITILFFLGGREVIAQNASQTWTSFFQRAEAEEAVVSAPTMTTTTAVITPYESLIQEAARRHDTVPANLIKAVIREESGFNPKAENPDSGAQGLMQILPSTAKQYGIGGDLFDPERNIGVGTRHLAELLKQYRGNMELALAAYNAGTETVDTLTKERGAKSFAGIVDALPLETQAYVPKVMQANREYASAVVVGGQQFVLRTNEEKPTVYVKPGDLLEIRADKKWTGLSSKPDGSRVPIEMPAGLSQWRARDQAGHLYVKGLEPGTTTLLVRVVS